MDPYNRLNISERNFCRAEMHVVHVGVLNLPSPDRVDVYEKHYRISMVPYPVRCKRITRSVTLPVGFLISCI